MTATLALLGDGDRIVTPEGTPTLPFQNDWQSLAEAVEGALTEIEEVRSNAALSVKSFGAVGDGATDDTAAILAAYNYALATGVGIFVPSGTYMVDALAFDATGAVASNRFVMFGEGASSIIKVKDGSITSSFRPLFRFKMTSAMEQIEFRDLFIDNNARGSEAAWLAAGGGFAHQQAHTFQIYATVGRYKHVVFDNVTIKDPVADGFNNSSPSGNVDKVDNYTVNNCREIERTRPRASIQFSTLPRNTIINGFSGQRIETETNTAVPSLCTYTAVNCVVEILDLAALEADQVSRLVDVHLTSVHATVSSYFADIKLTASNCRLLTATTSRYDRLSIGSSFTGCTFVCPYDSATSTIRGIQNYWAPGSVGAASDLLFDNCRFEIGSTDPAISPTGYALDLEMSPVVANLERYKTTVRNCWFDSRFAYSVNAYRAGRVYLEGNDYGGKTAAIRYGVTSTRSVHLTVDGGKFHRVTGAAMDLAGITVDQVTTLAYLILTGDWKGVTTAFTVSSGIPSNMDAANQLQSNRRIQAAAVPVAGLRGDIIEMFPATAAAVDSYRCTASSTTAAVWKARTTLAA